MSAVWLKIITIVCLCCTELTDAGVVWKEVGQSITIQCNADSEQQLMSFSLKKGLNQDEEIFFTESTSQKHNIKEMMKERVQAYTGFPKVEILIKNLTVNDTGPYWCLYDKIDNSDHKKKNTNSLLLVVTEKQRAVTATVETLVCESSSLNVVVLSVVAFAGILLAIMLFLVIWITNKNSRVSSRPEKTSRHTNNNDVYEDMRGTIRR
uniref:Chromosome 3 SCAF14707, whole genome shotgun sequence, Uncharacterized protein n=1 Tax=Iconisemion striatum TaxID=60296 RepID=A0A1A7YBF6_9TELE